MFDTCLEFWVPLAIDLVVEYPALLPAIIYSEKMLWHRRVTEIFLPRWKEREEKKETLWDSVSQASSAKKRTWNNEKNKIA